MPEKSKNAKELYIKAWKPEDYPEVDEQPAAQEEQKVEQA
jgi:hypothetical protein